MLRIVNEKLKIEGLYEYLVDVKVEHSSSDETQSSGEEEHETDESDENSDVSESLEMIKVRNSKIS